MSHSGDVQKKHSTFIVILQLIQQGFQLTLALGYLSLALINGFPTFQHELTFVLILPIIGFVLLEQINKTLLLWIDLTAILLDFIKELLHRMSTTVKSCQ